MGQFILGLYGPFATLFYSHLKQCIALSLLCQYPFCFLYSFVQQSYLLLRTIVASALFILQLSL